MTRIELITEIRAPAEVCFDLARDIDLHKRSMRAFDEEAIGDRASGLLELGEQGTWRAKHFGIFHQHTAKITALKRPAYCRDDMVRGRFRDIVHDHWFEATPIGARMCDLIECRSPLGPFGAFADVVVLRSDIRNLHQHRNAPLRGIAETTLGTGPTV